MSKKNKKVLILGGSGFVGSHTCFELLKRGYKVIIYDLNINYFVGPKRTPYINYLIDKTIKFGD